MDKKLANGGVAPHLRQASGSFLYSVAFVYMDLLCFRRTCFALSVLNAPLPIAEIGSETTGKMYVLFV